MTRTPSTMSPLGTAAPDFALPDPTGRVHALAELAAAPALVVVFLSNHCPYVRHVADRLGALAGHLQERGVAVVGIQSNDVAAYPDDRPELMTVMAAQHGWTFPYLYDESQAVAKAFRAACTPDFFVFDAGRRLAYRGQMDGARPHNNVPVTGEDLVAAVEAVLAGGSPSPGQRPSLGCNIKWKPNMAPNFA